MTKEEENLAWGESSTRPSQTPSGKAGTIRLTRRRVRGD